MTEKILNEILASERTAFLRMAREFPMRTVIFSFGLPIFALLQLLNGLVYNGSVLFIGGFAALLTIYSVKITQYHVAVFRRQKLVRYCLSKR